MKKPQVYITRLIPEQAIQRLQENCEVKIWQGEAPVPRDVLLSEVQTIDGLLCLLTDRIDDKILSCAPRLRVVSNMAVGYDNIDIPAARQRKIPVGNTPGVLTDATADLAWTLMMAAARRIPEAVAYVKEGRWTTWGPMLLTGMEFHDATLGIIGMGRIGAAVAKRAGGFDMKIIYTDSNRNMQVEEATGARQVDLDTLIATADFISIHTNLTPETRRLINEPRLRMMKPTAVLINTARGPIVDPDALYTALSERRIWAAALDVTDPEPIPLDHPLLKLPNCLIVPHIGSASIKARTDMALIAADNLLAGLAGRPLPFCVNPEIYKS